MNRFQGCGALVIFCSFFSVVVLCMAMVEDGGGQEEDQLQRPSSSLSLGHTLKRMFSFSTSYWDRAKSIMNRAQAYFFPPNLDFRGSDEGGGEGRATEKVKEAVTDSLGKTKATVEDSAKSAAKVASETVHKTKEKVKRSLSKSGCDHHNEL